MKPIILQKLKDNKRVQELILKRGKTLIENSFPYLLTFKIGWCVCFHRKPKTTSLVYMFHLNQPLTLIPSAHKKGQLNDKKRSLKIQISIFQISNIQPLFMHHHLAFIHMYPNHFKCTTYRYQWFWLLKYYFTTNKSILFNFKNSFWLFCFKEKKILVQFI